MKNGVRRLREGDVEPPQCEQPFDVALDVEEVDPVAIMRPALPLPGTEQHTAAQRQLRKTIRLLAETLPGFEKPHARRLPGQVGAQCSHEPRKQAGSHHRVFARDGIDNRNRVATGIEKVGDLRVDEAVGDSLRISQVDEQVL